MWIIVGIGLAVSAIIAPIAFYTFVLRPVLRDIGKYERILVELIDRQQSENQ